MIGPSIREMPQVDPVHARVRVRAGVPASRVVTSHDAQRHGLHEAERGEQERLGVAACCRQEDDVSREVTAL